MKKPTALEKLQETVREWRKWAEVASASSSQEIRAQASGWSQCADALAPLIARLAEEQRVAVAEAREEGYKHRPDKAQHGSCLCVDCIVEALLVSRKFVAQQTMEAMVAAAYRSAAGICKQMGSEESLLRNIFSESEPEGATLFAEKVAGEIEARISSDSRAALRKLLREANENGFIAGWTRHTMYKPLSEGLTEYLAELSAAAKGENDGK